MKKAPPFESCFLVLRFFLAVVVALALDNSTLGGTLTFTNRAAFNAAATPYGPLITEGYEGYANDIKAGARTITLNDFKVSYDLSVDDSKFGVTDILDIPNGLLPTDGTNFLSVTFPTATGPVTTLTFLFNTPIYAFGTDTRDLEAANLTYHTSTGAGGIAVTPAASGTIKFFGIVSDDQPFTSISFTEPPAVTGDAVVFDQTTCPPTNAAGIPSGLVSWWRGESNTLDSVGGHHGTGIGIGYVPGAVGKAFTFGSSGHISVTNPPYYTASNAFTVVARIEITTKVFTAPSVVNNRSQANNDGFTLEQTYNDPGRVGFYVNQSGLTNTYNGVSASGWGLNTFYHVAATFDAASGTMALYRNGVLVAFTNGLPHVPMFLGPAALFEIGQNINAPAFHGPWPGLIDEVQFYNRALSAAEVALLAGGGSVIVQPFCTNLTFNLIPATTNCTQNTNVVCATNSVVLTPAYTNCSFTTNLLCATNSVLVTPAATNCVATTNVVCATNTVVLVPVTTNCVPVTNTVCVTNAVVLTPTPTNCYFVVQPFTNTTIVRVTNTANIPTNGLIAWWRGESNALDSAGTNHGTLHGNVTYVPGHIGQAFSTGDDGSGNLGITNGSYVDVGALSGLDNATGFTISTWYSYLGPGYSPYGGQIFSQASWRITECVSSQVVGAGFDFYTATQPSQASELTFGLPMAPEPADLCAVYAPGTHERFFHQPFAPPSTQWVHLVVTWRSIDGLEVFYVDGKQSGAFVTNAGLTIPKSFPGCAGVPHNTNFRLGSAVIGGRASADCTTSEVRTYEPDWLDEMRIYNRALSSSEVTKLYQEVVQYTTNIVTNLTTLICPDPGTNAPTGSSVPVSYCVNVTNSVCVETKYGDLLPYLVESYPGLSCSNFVYQVCTNLYPVFTNVISCSNVASQTCTTNDAVLTNVVTCSNVVSQVCTTNADVFTNVVICTNQVVQNCTNVPALFTNVVTCSNVVTTTCVTNAAITTNLTFCTAPFGRLMILNAPSNNVNLRWSSQTNAFYLLQSSDQLLPLSWTNFWGISPGIRGTLNVFDPTAPRPKRFYRLLTTEP